MVLYADQLVEQFELHEEVTEQKEVQKEVEVLGDEYYQNNYWRTESEQELEELLKDYQ